jgi:hypothetical protein
MCSLSTVVDLYVAVNNRQPLSIDMERQKSVPSVANRRHCSNQIFNIVVNSLRSFRDIRQGPESDRLPKTGYYDSAEIAR